MVVTEHSSADQMAPLSSPFSSSDGFGFFGKKKKGRKTPEAPPEPATPPISSAALLQQQSAGTGTPWVPIIAISIGVIVIGVSLYLILTKKKRR